MPSAFKFVRLSVFSGVYPITLLRDYEARQANWRNLREVDDARKISRC